MRLLLPKAAGYSAPLWLAKERAGSADVMVAVWYHDVNTQGFSEQKASLLVMIDTPVLFSDTTSNCLYCRDQTDLDGCIPPSVGSPGLWSLFIQTTTDWDSDIMLQFILISAMRSSFSLVSQNFTSFGFVLLVQTWNGSYHCSFVTKPQ